MDPGQAGARACSRQLTTSPRLVSNCCFTGLLSFCPFTSPCRHHLLLSTVVYFVQVRRRHQLGTVVTPYHIREAATHLGMNKEDVRECVQELGGTVWEEDNNQVNRRLGRVRCRGWFTCAFLSEPVSYTHLTLPTILLV